MQQKHAGARYISQLYSSLLLLIIQLSPGTGIGLAITLWTRRSSRNVWRTKKHRKWLSSISENAYGTQGLNEKPCFVRFTVAPSTTAEYFGSTLSGCRIQRIPVFTSRTMYDSRAGATLWEDYGEVGTTLCDPSRTEEHLS